MSATPFADLNALAAHLRQELQKEQDPKSSFCSMPTMAPARPGFPPPSRTSANTETNATRSTSTPSPKICFLG
jgi:hypothetical protein